MSVTFNDIPITYNNYESILATHPLTNPENTCSLLICALNIFIQNKEDGIEAINYLKGPQPLSNHDISFLSDRLYDKKYLPKVYFNGANPANSYTPSTPYKIDFFPDPRPQDCQPGYMKLYLSTPAFDSPRYIMLRNKDNNWYLWEYFGILMSVKTPANEDPWA